MALKSDALIAFRERYHLSLLSRYYHFEPLEISKERYNIIYAENIFLQLLQNFSGNYLTFFDRK